ncbi:MAG: flagellar basal body-associated FliL family protein [Verrucomicrobia bacterium]|nr:flagellar basal body-associated FliL family protein [Verrucomicrobiota bacterium]
MWKSADGKHDDAAEANASAGAPQRGAAESSGTGLRGLLGKKLIIVIVAGLMLAGGGIGAATLLGGGGPSEGSDKKKVEAPLTCEFPDLTVNVYGTVGTRILRCAMQVEVDSPKALDELRLRQIVYRDAIIEILQSKRIEDLEYPAVNSIKRVVRDRFNRMMMSGSVVEVYFSEFLIH